MGTEMKELEEHVAKAMHSADYKSGRFEWEEYDAGTRAAYLESARAALRAIRESNTHMLVRVEVINEIHDRLDRIIARLPGSESS